MLQYQDAVRDAVNVPVCLSSLLQLPFISRTLRPSQPIGIVTADSNHLSESFLRRAGVEVDNPVVIHGMQDQPEFGSATRESTGTLDSDLVSEETVGVARRMVDGCPDMGAVLLECSMLPPYAKAGPGRDPSSRIRLHHLDRLHAVGHQQQTAARFHVNPLGGISHHSDREVRYADLQCESNRRCQRVLPRYPPARCPPGIRARRCWQRQQLRYPVLYRTVPGASENVLFGDPDLNDAVVETAKELEAQGVRGISSDCGFFINYQDVVREAVDVPVSLSSLLQLPLLSSFIGPDQPIGVITASTRAFSNRVLELTGVEPERHVIIRGMRDEPYWMERSRTRPPRSTPTGSKR